VPERPAGSKGVAARHPGARTFEDGADRARRRCGAWRTECAVGSPSPFPPSACVPRTGTSGRQRRPSRRCGASLAASRSAQVRASLLIFRSAPDGLPEWPGHDGEPSVVL